MATKTKKNSKSVKKINGDNGELYKASVKILGQMYNATGSSIMEALENLKPLNSKGRGILTIEHGVNKKERILTNVATFRLFNSHGLTREIALKNTYNLFQGL